MSRTLPVIQTTLHGGKAGLDDKNGLVLVNPRNGENQLVVSALPGKLLAAKVTIQDDFLAATLSTQWNALKGSDGAAAYPVIAVAKNGTVALVTSGAGANTMAVTGSELASNLVFEADSGNLVFEAKVKLSAITTLSAFFGFTDNAALEAAFTGSGSGNGITSNATDAVGFLISTNMTDGTKFWGVGVKADTDITHFNTGITPVADTYNTLRVEVDTAGTASFYIDGVMVGTPVANAVTVTTALCAAISIYELTTSARTLTADYVFASQDRA